MTRSGTIGKYDVEIVSVRIIKEEYGDDECIVVKYKWTNNNDRSVSFSDTFVHKVFQDGIECVTEYATFDDEANYDSSKRMAAIQPGTSLEVEAAYKKK